MNDSINVMFVGSDWQRTDKWAKIKNELEKIGCKVVYLPHTDGISSTMLINDNSTKQEVYKGKL